MTRLQMTWHAGIFSEQFAHYFVTFIRNNSAIQSRV